MQMSGASVKMAVKNWWGQRAPRASRLPRWRASERGRSGWRRGRAMFLQRKVSRRYHGSHCDSRINFNAPPPPRWLRVTPSSSLPSFFFLSFLLFFGRVWVPVATPHTPHSPLPNLARVTSSRSTCTWSCECVCPCGRGGGCGVRWKRKKKSAWKIHHKRL